MPNLDSEKIQKKLALIKKIQTLNTLLQNKFNFSKNNYLTRESKINLNTE